MKFLKSGLIPGSVFERADQTKVELVTEELSVTGDVVASGNLYTNSGIVQGKTIVAVSELNGTNVELFRFDIRHTQAVKLVIGGHFEHKSQATELLISCNISDVASVEYGNISPSDEDVFVISVARVGDFIRVVANSTYDIEYTAHAVILQH